MMTRLATLCIGFARDTRGATAIEYAMIAAGIGAAVASTIWGLGNTIKSTFYDKLLSIF
jgi:pilus assembly protein Flp/PilA